MKLNYMQLVYLKSLVMSHKNDNFTEDELYIVREIDSELENIRLDAKACGED